MIYHDIIMIIYYVQLIHSLTEETDTESAVRFSRDYLEE